MQNPHVLVHMLEVRLCVPRVIDGPNWLAREPGGQGARQPGKAASHIQGAREPAIKGSREPGTDSVDGSERADDLESLGPIEILRS